MYVCTNYTYSELHIFTVGAVHELNIFRETMSRDIQHSQSSPSFTPMYICMSTEDIVSIEHVT